VSTADDNQPATKGDVRTIVDAAERRIILEIGRAVNAVAEQISSNARVVHEKYQDLPPRISTSEQQFTEHAADAKIHKRPPAAKHTRRPTKPRRK
jgi:hypothetical protein